MISGGDGKLKGKRNRRAAQSQFYVWKRIRVDVAERDWRFYTVIDEAALFYGDDSGMPKNFRGLSHLVDA